MTQQTKELAVSILDLVPVRQGFPMVQAFEDMKNLERHAEQLGYKRFWLSEHHNTPTLASSATSILISKVLEATDTIEVGSGGIMLPNHTPLVVAEQFGTLETMHPGRVNLGLGRAPGTDMQTARALRRTTQETAFQFPEDVEELQRYLGPLEAQESVKAYRARCSQRNSVCRMRLPPISPRSSWNRQSPSTAAVSSLLILWQSRTSSPAST